MHKNGAYWVLDQEDRFGITFPSDGGIVDISLLMCTICREEILAGQFTREVDDRVRIGLDEFHEMIRTCRKRFGQGWGKGLRELTDELLYLCVVEHMEKWALIDVQEDDVMLLPAIAKWGGRYPDGFEGGEEDGESI